VPDAVVTCEVCEGSVRTGADGRFTLPSPPYVARFTLSARKGRLTASRTVPREDSGTPVELTLQPATRVHGLVYREDGRPAAGFALEAGQSDTGELVTLVTGSDGRYSGELPPGSYRFLLGEGRGIAGEPVVVAQVEGAEQRLDFGPAPGTGTLTVRVKPEPGRALWLVPGEVPRPGNPPSELMRARYAQIVYQPHTETVTLRGLPPGRYTLVWAHFHHATEEGPLVRSVDMPVSGEISLVR
jgi:hypothetical protein